MTIDVADLLREFELRVIEGGQRVRWRLGAPNGGSFEVEPSAPVARLDAHEVRRLARDGRRRLLVGETATEGVVKRALAEEIDILTAQPAQLIHAGHVYSLDTGAGAEPSRQHGRAAWTRWVIERYLVLATEPARQATIAQVTHTTQQSVSNTAHHLMGLAANRSDGLVAADRGGLLAHWRDEYPGPGGMSLGWYSIDPIVDQVTTAVEAAHLLEVRALVSGDVAADRLAPWKLPARGRVYFDGPVDLEEDGFVPAPVEEATLITCVPSDPSLWQLSDLRSPLREKHSMPLADPAIIYWDLTASGELDSHEAAKHLAAVAIGVTE